MITLSITYIALREFPLVVFTLKTFRVCLCSLYQIELNVSKKLLIKIFSSEWIILFICLLYSASVAIFTYFDFSTWESPANGRMTF